MSDDILARVKRANQRLEQNMSELAAEREIERLRAFVAWIVREFGKIKFNKKPGPDILGIVQERHAAYLELVVGRARRLLGKEAGPQ